MSDNFEKLYTEVFPDGAVPGWPLHSQGYKDVAKQFWDKALQVSQAELQAENERLKDAYLGLSKRHKFETVNLKSELWAANHDIEELKGKLLVMGEAAQKLVDELDYLSSWPKCWCGEGHQEYVCPSHALKSALSTTQPDIQRIKDEIRAEERERIGKVLDSRFRDYMACSADAIHKTIASKLCTHFAAVLHDGQSLLPNKKEVE